MNGILSCAISRIGSVRQFVSSKGRFRRVLKIGQLWQALARLWHGSSTALARLSSLSTDGNGLWSRTKQSELSC
jgi:hypothetical protein